jgi:hypothetical protein
MTTDPNNPHSRESKTVEADVNSALDTLFAEARNLMQEMKGFLRPQRDLGSK